MSTKSAGPKPLRTKPLPQTLDADAKSAVAEALRREASESVSAAEQLSLADIRRTVAERTTEAERLAGEKAPPNRAQKVFGVAGPDVTLAGQPYHLAELSTAGTMAVRAFLEANGLPSFPEQEGATIGECVVRFATLLDTFAGLEWLLPRIIAEEVPAGIVYEASERELVAAVDAFWAASGIDWYERLAKNSLARQNRATTTT